MSLRDRLANPGVKLTRSDTRVVRALLADYPAAGLGTVASLARTAGVSDPTVTRLLAKLGFEGFPDFHKALLEEVDARMRSPLSMMAEKRSNADQRDSRVQSYFRSVRSGLDRTAVTTPTQSFDVAVNLILRAKGHVLLLGGRFSRHLAGILAGYLSQIRAGVLDLGVLNVESFDKLLDVGRQDVLIVFDYRRYQTDVVRFAKQAAAQGAALVLFTDIFQSPLAALASTVVTADIEVNSPYDSMVPALAQAEALASQIVSVQGDASRDRIERLESIRGSNAATIDAHDFQSSDEPTPKATAEDAATRKSRLNRSIKPPAPNAKEANMQPTDGPPAIRPARRNGR